MIAEFTLPTDRTESRPFSDLIGEILQTIPYSESDIFAIRLALDEALVNAIEHGNQRDHFKSVRVVFCATAEQFDVTITDEGAGFDHEATRDYEWDHWSPPGGRGLLLMRGFMTEVQYHGRGNVVTMTKVRGQVQ